MSCTQEELLQAMHSLLRERRSQKGVVTPPLQPVAKPAPRVQSAPIAVVQAPLRAQPSTITVAQVPLEQDQKQIALLKKANDELSEKVAKLTKEKEELAPAKIDEDPSSIKQDLLQTQRQLRSAKERTFELEEEVRRLNQFRHTLQHELKEASGKSFEIEPLKKQLDLYKEKTSELENKLQTAASAGNKAATALFEEEHKKSQKLICELEDQKQLLKQQMAITKDHEEKIEILKKEKSEEARRLIELKKELDDLQMLANRRSDEVKTHLRSLQSMQDALDEQKKQKEEQSLRLSNKDQEIQEHSNKVEKILAELAEAKKEKEEAYLIQKELSKRLASDAQKLQEATLASNVQIELVAEQKKQIEMVEGHLARRIKECTTLSESLEEKSHLLGQIEERLKNMTDSFESLKASKNEMDEQNRIKIEELEQKTLALDEQCEAQLAELTELKELREKYLRLEDLIERSCQVLWPQTLPPFSGKKVLLKKGGNPISQSLLTPQKFHDMFQ